jgi:hypothetical protein
MFHFSVTHSFFIYERSFDAMATFISLKNTLHMFHFGVTHSFFISERSFDAMTCTYMGHGTWVIFVMLFMYALCWGRLSHGSCSEWNLFGVLQQLVGCASYWMVFVFILAILFLVVLCVCVDLLSNS